MSEQPTTTTPFRCAAYRRTAGDRPSLRTTGDPWPGRAAHIRRLMAALGLPDGRPLVVPDEAILEAYRRLAAGDGGTRP